LRLENSALSYAAGRQLETADATLTIARATLDNIIAGKLTVPEAVGSGAVAIAGNAAKVVELFSLLDDLHRMFEIVEPKQR
jgi:alkyl sulfatase BDS1-like metallo-beta-lactamase superfamily hydrolase